MPVSRRASSQGFDFLDPRLLATVEDLELVARGVVEGFQHGLHRSPYVGFSVEFASHREYLPGDDLRHINWKLYGRQDRLYVKQYDAETNLNLHLVVDTSGSMQARNAGLTKQHYAAMLAASLAHLALHQRDAVGITLFADTTLDNLKPRAHPDQLFEILALLADRRRHAAADSPRALHEVAELMPRRGLVVILSDFFYETTELLECLDHFKHTGHDMLLFQLLDPIEQGLPLDGPVKLYDLETGDTILTQAHELRAHYQKAMTAWQQELRTACEGRDIDFRPLVTDQPLHDGLTDYLALRSELF